MRVMSALVLVSARVSARVPVFAHAPAPEAVTVEVVVVIMRSLRSYEER